MGEVYLAYDSDLEREIAIKVLRDGSGESSDRERRFVQEAKAASGLHHPNVAHVYEIGTHEGLRFIAMERIQGETLRRRIAHGPLPIDEVLELASQITAAVAAAHRAGVIHRDLKPENVIITPDGYAKVLDFGLAKLRERRAEDDTLLKTAPGLAMGTLAYMPPEQIVGAEITEAADVFSLGVLIYEMAAGTKPFEALETHDLVSAILTRPPRPLHDLRPDVPPKLEIVISRSLAKNPEERFPHAGELHDHLRLIRRERAGSPPVDGVVAKKGRWIATVVAVVVAVAILAIGAWATARWRREREVRDAREKIAVAERLLKERRLAEAYEIAVAAAAILPADDRVRDVIAKTSERLTIESDPAGATVSLQRYRGSPQRMRMGVTPLTLPRIAHADYLLTLEKSGYATATRTISTMPLYHADEATAEPLAIRIRMAAAAKVPPGMVFVEGGTYRLSGSYRPSERAVDLRDFVIDRHEVSNREFEQFVRAGGYRRRELWKHPFVDEGRRLPFEEAMARFRDTTALSGPRGWSGGAPPPGREDHPVTGVTWYEAAAFAEWKGKQLPTIYQWEKAARHPATSTLASAFPWGFVQEGIDATERANFLGKGAMPVESMPFGASPYGALHMAGNVAEWCRNPHPPGYAARGGAWSDGIYQFGKTAAYPPFYSAPTLGFRCVRGGGDDQGDFAISPSGFVPEYTPVDDAAFEEFRRRYEYRREPLNARVVERVETADWTRETITFVVAGKSVPAYLYLPKGFRRPLQVIQYAPAGDVVAGVRTLPHSIEIMVGPLIRGGRAVFSVQLEGFLGRPRPAGFVRPRTEQDEYVDYVVSIVTEMRRGLDYLEMRPDIDRSRIALLGGSAGSGPGVFVAALEPRLRSVVYWGTGITRQEERHAPAACRIHFVPRIQVRSCSCMVATTKTHR